MNRRSRVLPWPFFFIFLLGCGTWVGNAVDQSGETPKTGSGSSSLRVEIGPESTNATGAIEARHTAKDGSSLGTLQFSALTLNVARVRFTKEGKDVAVTDWKEPKLVQLGTATTELLSDVTIAADAFDEIHIETTDALGAVTMRGAFLNGAATTPVDLIFSKKVALTLAVAPSQVNTGADKKSTLSVKLGFDSWFDFKGDDFDLRDLGSPITMASRTGLEDVLRQNAESTAGSATPGTGSNDDDDDDEDDDPATP